MVTNERRPHRTIQEHLKIVRRHEIKGMQTRFSKQMFRLSSRLGFASTILYKKYEMSISYADLSSAAFIVRFLVPCRFSVCFKII